MLHNNYCFNNSTLPLFKEIMATYKIDSYAQFCLIAHIAHDNNSTLQKYSQYFLFRIYMRHSCPNRPSYDTYYFFCPRNTYDVRCPKKKYRKRSFRFFENFLGSILPKITKKTEDDTVGRYRFG